MRFVSLALAVSLSTSGCAYLAIPPAAGATVGAMVGAARRSSDKDVSVTTHAVVGGVVGVAIDAVLVVIAAIALSQLTFGDDASR